MFTTKYKTKITYLCKICNNPSTNTICENCERLIEQGYISKSFYGYIINSKLLVSKLDNNANFFNPQKEYKVKETLLTKYEKILYETIKMKLGDDLIVLPQVNLQTIIETNSVYRNNELFRNIDFCIFEKETLKPILAVELNGNSHLTSYGKKRDNSVSSILERANLPLVIIENEELETKNTVEIYNLIKKQLDKIKN